jgi:16S rRNA (guanine1207-N2)-methyltransferase
VSHYFESPDTGLDDTSHRLVPMRIADREVQLHTAPGVFSGSRLDPGTAVLLDEVPFPETDGDLLDIGCGYGPIALTLAAHAAPEATVWAVDVNDRAIELCRRNAQLLGLVNVDARRPEEVPDGVRFSFICSNPAIRIGKVALHDMLTHWLDRLTSGGEAYFVVQRNLGADSLHRWLNEQGWRTSRIASRRGFRILRCVARNAG